jgi:NFU1 iron-sulfur cluster scaffold homolog, mitochondrial
MPKIAEIEYTPNPNAVKFVLKESVAAGFPKSFPDRIIAAADPLAAALFDVGHVVSVFMQDKFITVTKDDELSWSELLPKLAPPIRAAGASQAPAPAVSHEFEKPDENDPFIAQILKVLQDTILPALAADGGGLEVIGRHEKQVMIRYQGACSTCPAGMTGTLMAIEGILKKEVDPEIVVITV